MTQIPFVNLSEQTLSLECKNALAYKFIHKMGCLIFMIDFQEQKLHIALIDESCALGIIKSHIQSLFPDFQMCLFLTKKEDFNLFSEQIRTHERFCTLVNALKAEHHRPNTLKNDDKNDISVAKLLDFILEICIQEKASDIHFESSPDEAKVRIRVDGLMKERFCLENDVFKSLSSRLKLECALDINQNRKSQDGRFTRILMQREFDFRLSSIPAFGGESLVIRILDKNTQRLELDHLGFDTISLKRIKESIVLPYGIIFLTGPTGSGKSTTLYAMLESIKSPNKKIITLEDPIEYQMDLVTQVLVNEKYDFGFNQALRALLRQDPDVIMVGEIRDEDTLQTAIKASLTGHLVLATLHANDSLGAIDRLLEMGAQDYLLASTLNAIISQRLARALCPHCKIPISSQKVFENLRQYGKEDDFGALKEKFEKGVFFAPKGCVHCDMQGYSGRLLIAECLSNSPHLKTYIKDLSQRESLQHSLLNPTQEGGFISMFQNAFQHFAQGETSLEEIYRVCKI